MALSSKDYVHLHNHTQYSLLDGLTKIPALIDRVIELGMKSVAITDHGTLSGAVEFYKEAKAKNIKPIIGLETYVAPRRHTDKDPGKDKNYFHLILLAMNDTGYQNLMRLSTIANLQGFYYRPRIDRELLEKYNEGLIVLSGCIGGEVGDMLRQGQYEQAKQTAAWYKKVFKDRYYLEIQDHGHSAHPSKWPDQIEVTKHTFNLSEELDIPCVVTCDAHYLNHKDQQAHEILLCVQTGSFLSDENRMSLKDFELYVTEPDSLIKRWGKKHPDLILNTSKIADRCNVELKLGEYLIPKFPVPPKETEKSYLDKLTFRGLVQRYTSKTPKKADSIAALKKLLPERVIERAGFELGIINGMGFSGYFLIVQDFINWGKDQGIVFGPGRGSGAGSIIAYALRITELDPLKYDLLFERFLNPDRISMPDFDIDIQDSRRDEVIRYCVEKYGEGRVANIVTFGRMAARNAVRDVARVLQVPYSEADRLAKMIPQPVQGRHIPLEKSLRENPDLKNEYETNKQAKEVFDLAVQLEGTIRSHGVHAAGVVIAPDDIVKFVPLELAQKGVVATQYSMGPIEEMGLLKMDFLGLSNLTTIKNALRIIKKVHAKDITITDIPLDDEKTYELLASGNTTGVFQLESAGMKRYLKELQPSVFEDIISMVALYRPGPMQWIDDFIDRKHGRKPITYLHPAMEPALRSTYGVIVTQEQVMQISKEMCGFTGGQADTLRKGIGKKIPAVLAKMKKEFIEGAIKTVGADRPLMEKFWKQLEDFAAYCFNKAHSACYAMIAYWTAYLKANYPAAFMAALMTSDYDDTDRLAIEITECKHMGIGVLAPDVNESFMEFAVVPETNQIRFGMLAVKNVGSGAVEEILRAREAGHFTSLEDFFSRVNVRVVNRKALESLIKAGAFDSLGERGILLHNIDLLLAYATRTQKQSASGQTDLFGNLVEGDQVKSQITLEKVASPASHQLLVWERELLGLYLSRHPLEDYETILSELALPINTLKPEHEGRVVKVGGAIEEVREIVTKNGQKMAFVKITDRFNQIELVLFPSVYQQTIGIWVRDRIVLAKGKISSKDRQGNSSSEIKILTEEAREITAEQASAYQSTGKKVKSPKQQAKAPTKKIVAAAVETSVAKLYLRLENSEDSRLLTSLKSTIDLYRGETEVVLVVGNTERRQAIKLPVKFEPNEESLAKLSDVVGQDNVKLR